MKTFARISLTLIALAATVAPTFAAGAQQVNYALTIRTTADQTTVGYVEVPVTPAVRDWFNAHGIDGSRVDAPIAALNQAYKNDINDLLSDSDTRDTLSAIINPVLKSALVRGQTEVASMRVGRYVWTMSIDGPEDHDDQ